MLVWLYISSTLHIAVLQPGRLLQQPYIASIGYISSRRAENIINYVIICLSYGNGREKYTLLMSLEMVNQNHIVLLQTAWPLKN